MSADCGLTKTRADLPPFHGAVLWRRCQTSTGWISVKRLETETGDPLFMATHGLTDCFA